jgi:hypothetical protein
MSIFLQNTVLLAQDSKDKAIPNLIPGNLAFGPGGAQEVLISYMQIVVFVVTLIAMLGLTCSSPALAWVAPAAPAPKTSRWPTCWASTPTTSSP